MCPITRETSIEEIAAVVSQTLERAGIRATLSGGGAAMLYSANEYQSYDLDFVSSERNSVIGEALAPLGFIYEAGTREFTHPETDYFVEFPPGPLAFGHADFGHDDATVIDTAFGPLRIITPTQCVMDRLAAYRAWNDPQSLDQALMVAARHPLDWSLLEAWSESEGIESRVLGALKRAGNHT